MSSITVYRFDSPLGQLVLGSYEQKLVLCDWLRRKMRTTIDRRIQDALDAAYLPGTGEVIQRTIMQLTEYFHRRRKSFEIPLLMVGTDFQKRVWNGLLEIPYGQTCSYSQLAERIADKQSLRAVASANGANALSILVPCHRVIGADGRMVGYAGGIKTKEKLLNLEQQLI